MLERAHWILREMLLPLLRGSSCDNHSCHNLLNEQFEASRPNQKWVADVTHIATRQGWASPSTIKDLVALS